MTLLGYAEKVNVPLGLANSRLVGDQALGTAVVVFGARYGAVAGAMPTLLSTVEPAELGDAGRSTAVVGVTVGSVFVAVGYGCAA